MPKFLLFLFVPGLLFSSTIYAASDLGKPVAKPLVSFKLSKFTSGIAMVVPRGTSMETLKDLVIGIDCAFKKNTLLSLGIGPTTPGGSQGDYFLVQVFIFDDPEAASPTKNKAWVELNPNRTDFAAKNQSYISKIKAYYGGSPNNKGGSIGYDDGVGKTATYKKIALLPVTACPAVAVSSDVKQKSDKLIQEKIEENKLFGPAPVQDGKDGSYSVVRRYLEAKMRDPNGLNIKECSKVFRTDKGWLVGCYYFTNENEFSTKFNWFTIRQNKVSQVHRKAEYTCCKFGVQPI